MGNKTPRVVIADDHPVFRMALRRVMPNADTIELASFAALKEHLVGALPDLVLLDLAMPDVDGFSALLYLRSQYPKLRVAVVSGHEQAAVIERALELGACAYIPKSLPLEVLGSALGEVLAGKHWSPTIDKLDDSQDDEDAVLSRRLKTLSPQQLRVLMALAEGRLNKQIAADLSITEATVKFHVTALLQKLTLTSRTQLAIVAQKASRLPVKASSLGDGA